MAKSIELFSFDREYHSKTNGYFAGVDEAGRGPWAGPVVAAAVILKPDAAIKGLNDSKKLTPEKREQLFDIIKEQAVAVGVGIMGADAVDALNILGATFSAMRKAVYQLPVDTRLLLVDGSLRIRELDIPQVCLVGGDGRSASIAAASVIAKVTRDRLMIELSRKYPLYGFEKHKGYGSPEHQAALKQYGPCPIHRKSFAPIRELLEGNHAG